MRRGERWGSDDPKTFFQKNLPLLLKVQKISRGIGLLSVTSDHDTSAHHTKCFFILSWLAQRRREKMISVNSTRTESHAFTRDCDRTTTSEREKIQSFIALF